ncbi:hypothetical protein JAAARDRAFT_205638 [Jaapia argillacea MUCL 33604]|uniref:Nephrocystin 3-like N-terminal domain-containing protein n=1 Tax=Jaapia argillacea MUCL 33604 TaxID=933084 RepID=A0A067PXR0_9AGAM|nr:hypothetical protein JAAARDRAFT_205638 [Jaapia argillacea MUCL 33604]
MATNTFDPIEKRLGPHVVPNVAHDEQERRKCQEGSRDEVIQIIMDWATAEDVPPILWVHGPAGSGKSTIALTVCSRLASEGHAQAPHQQLAASWFFSRDANRTTTLRFFTTVAYQLALSQPFLRDDITTTLVNNPKLFDKTHEIQLTKLILDQIRPFAESLQCPIIVVVDALDECKEDDAQNLVQVLVDALQGDRHLPIRFILTSRNDYAPIEGQYRLNSEMIRMVDLWEYDAHAPIRRFFEVELEKVERRRRHLIGAVRPWPSQPQLDTLTEKAGGLFIYASTLVAFVGDNQGRPDEKLEEAVKPEYDGLDALYQQVLDNAPQSCTTRFRNIVGIILYLPNQFNIVDLAHLIGVKGVDIRAALEGCGSIFMIPEDDHGVIRVLHASLSDFLTAGERSKIHFIGYQEHRLLLLGDCIRLLLQEYSSFPNVPPYMPRHLATCSAAVSYAYENWHRLFFHGVLYHPSSLHMDSALVAHLIDFFSNIKLKGSVEMWMLMVPHRRSKGIISVLSHIRDVWDPHPSSLACATESSLLRSFEEATSRHMWLMDCPSVERFSFQSNREVRAADLSAWARSKAATSDGVPQIGVRSIAWESFHDIIVVVGPPCATLCIRGRTQRSDFLPRVYFETTAELVDRPDTHTHKLLAALTIIDQQIYLIDILRLLQIFEFAEVLEVDRFLDGDLGSMWFAGCFWRNIIQHLSKHGSRFDILPAWEEDERFEAPGAFDSEVQKALRFADIQQTALLASLKARSVAEGLDEHECLFRMNDLTIRIEEEFSKQLSCLRPSRTTASPAPSLEPPPPYTVTAEPTPTFIPDTLSTASSEPTTTSSLKPPSEPSPADITKHSSTCVPLAEAPSRIISEPATPSIPEPPPTPALPPSSIVPISIEPLTPVIQNAQLQSSESETYFFQPFNVLLIVAFLLPLLLLALHAIYSG